MNPDERRIETVAVGDIIQQWMDTSKQIPVVLVVGGSRKYDVARKIKDQSTEPISGIVSLTAALARCTGSLPRGVCDYRLELGLSGEVDLILIGAGDTNTVSLRVLSAMDTLSPQVRFEAPISSQVLHHARDMTDKPEFGMLSCLKHPLAGVRNAIICAGNTAQGTNAALALLTRFVHTYKGGQIEKWTGQHQFAVRALYDEDVQIIWPSNMGLSDSVIHTRANYFIENVNMSDNYTIGQAAAVGPNARVDSVSFQQVWQQGHPDIDLASLAAELSELRQTLRAESNTQDHDIAIGELAAAEKAAREGNGPGILQHLKGAGKLALDAAVKIGTDVAAKAIEKAMGL